MKRFRNGQLQQIMAGRIERHATSIQAMNFDIGDIDEAVLVYLAGISIILTREGCVMLHEHEEIEAWISR